MPKTTGKLILLLKCLALNLGSFGSVINYRLTLTAMPAARGSSLNSDSVARAPLSPASSDEITGDGVIIGNN